ncbi:hypothetical protein ALTERO38_90418 [Alteromonas sp. 38]|nr:hypothetical protein ALTER154_10031 [Alteromonas sp. 154]VXC57618.1 hypothetical protein ALTERO38_90418 [Alteromonas sp. 38]
MRILILNLTKLSTFSNKESSDLNQWFIKLILMIFKDRHLLFVDKVR